MNTFRLLPWLGLLLLLQAFGCADEFQAKVVGVHDGDSITVLTNAKEQIKIRLEGIDAPELDQPYGKAAKKAMSDLVFGRQVTVQDKGKDLYGRTLADIYVEGLWVNLRMVEIGLAWQYRKYSKDPKLWQAEVKAHELNLGLWQDPSAVAPWEWRRRKKEE